MRNDSNVTYTYATTIGQAFGNQSVFYVNDTNLTPTVNASYFQPGNYIAFGNFTYASIVYPLYLVVFNQSQYVSMIMNSSVL